MLYAENFCSRNPFIDLVYVCLLYTSSVIRGLIKYMCNARTIADLPPSFNNFAILKLGKLPLMVCVWVFVVVLAYLSLIHI